MAKYLKEYNKMEDDEIEIDLIALAKALWHRLWAIILAAVVIGGATFSYARFYITPMYRAEALMYVNNSSFSVGSARRFLFLHRNLLRHRVLLIHI